MNELTFPIIFMLAVVIIEGLIITRSHHQSVNWRELTFNLNSGHIMLWLFRGLELFCYGFVVSHYSLGITDNWSPLWVWILAILAWDFGFYWLHRLHHTFRALWVVHVVHHQGEQFNLSLGVRNSWYSSLTSIPFFMLLALIGIPLEIFITVSIAHYTIQFFNHSALIPPLGWWEKIMVTPHHHKVHHVKQGHYSQRNFGGSFIIWDKLFGTYSALPDADYQYGIRGEPASENPFIDSNRPFLRLLGIKRQVITNFQSKYHIHAFALVSGTLLLFTLVIGYVYLYGYGYNGTSMQQVSLFILLGLGTIALSGLSSGYSWGLYSWFILASVLGSVIIFYWHWQNIFWLLTTSLLWLHALALLCGLGRNPNHENIYVN